MVQVIKGYLHKAFLSQIAMALPRRNWNKSYAEKILGKSIVWDSLAV
jgi:hypothetical protein